MSQSPGLPLHMRRDGFGPAAELEALRDGEGVRRVTLPFGQEAWLVTRHADVRAVLGDPELFRISSAAGILPGAQTVSDEQLAQARVGNLLAWDPPEHTRLRRMLTPEFTRRRMRELEPRIRRIVDDRLDAMSAGGPPADLLASFALPIPSLAICELLGVPYDDRESFRHRAGRMLDVSAPVEEREALQRESRAYMLDLVTRVKAAPGADLLGMLAREHGDDLSAAELAGIGNLLLLAGHDTTSNMLALGALALLRDPAQLKIFRAEPGRVDAAVEELLRWLSVVHSGTAKVAARDVEIAGRAIGAGDLIVCSLPAANRDPALVPDPGALDLTRDAAGHLAFGHGVHHCLGAPLARMQLRIALPALFGRFPNLRVGEDDARFRSYHLIYGLTSLRVTW